MTGKKDAQDDKGEKVARDDKGGQGGNKTTKKRHGAGLCLLIAFY
jgi:hypothetical protein